MTETPLIQLKDIYKIYEMGDTKVYASDGVFPLCALAVPAKEKPA